ncbi:MAG: hypothetical protein Q4B71_01485 [Cardiobacteriaceae bacterium]|nr:hypothetical protein [Cardiobacteriaceae bacterium]
MKTIVLMSLGLLCCVGCGQKKDLYVPLENELPNETTPLLTPSNPS